MPIVHAARVIAQRIQAVYRAPCNRDENPSQQSAHLAMLLWCFAHPAMLAHPDNGLQHHLATGHSGWIHQAVTCPSMPWQLLHCGHCCWMANTSAVAEHITAPPVTPAAKLSSAPSLSPTLPNCPHASAPRPPHSLAPVVFDTRSPWHSEDHRCQPPAALLEG